MTPQMQPQWLCSSPWGPVGVPPQVATTASSKVAKNKLSAKSKNEKKKTKNKKNVKRVSGIKDKSNSGPDAQISGEDPGMMAKFVEAKARRLSDGDLTSVPFVSEALHGEAAEVHAAVTKFLVLDADCHGQALSLWPAPLLSAFPEFHTSSKPRLDLVLVSLVMMCRRNRSSGCAVHDFIEYSAGSAMLTKQCLLKNLDGIALDKCLMVEHDNTTPEGLRLWSIELAKTKLGALTWFGTQCSSFSALCMNNSQRWAENLFLGDVTREFVRYGNCQMVITALLMLVSFWCGNVPVLEQPLNSTMPLCPPLATVLRFVKATRVVTWHKAFGAKTKKPLQILSSSDMIGALRRPMPSGKSDVLARRGDGGTFSGIKKKLVASQAYTPLFGIAVADMIAASFGRTVAE